LWRSGTEMAGGPSRNWVVPHPISMLRFGTRNQRLINSRSKQVLSYFMLAETSASPHHDALWPPDHCPSNVLLLASTALEQGSAFMMIPLTYSPNRLLLKTYLHRSSAQLRSHMAPSRSTPVRMHAAPKASQPS
jgi:hypothetical protein